jgi:hypothetical protein
MESSNNPEFTETSRAKHKQAMKQFLDIIDAVSDHTNTAYTGKDAIKELREMKYGLGDLNVLKALPLAALVGLFNIRTCFKDVLYGELPKSKPHYKEVYNRGCNTQKLQQALVCSLNEKLGVPREFFYHGDHVLCLSIGQKDNAVDVFLPQQSLVRFVVTGPQDKPVIGIERRLYGSKWETHLAHEWDQTKPQDYLLQEEEEEEEEEQY